MSYIVLGSACCPVSVGFCMLSFNKSMDLLILPLGRLVASDAGFFALVAADVTGDQCLPCGTS